MGINRRAPATIIAILLTLASGSPPADADPCYCAQTSPGWLLFEDSNWKTPDFWHLDQVPVQEITFCPHAIQFLFVEQEESSSHLISLTFANPLTQQQARCARDLSCALAKYARLRATIDDLSGGVLERDGQVSFLGTALEERPRIVRPSSLLALEWYGSRVLLRGCIDVYMTLLP